MNVSHWQEKGTSSVEVNDNPLSSIFETEPLLNDGSVRMTLRYNSTYASFVEHHAIRTGLDKVQIIRLAIHLAPFDPMFNAILDQYVREDQRGIVFIKDWTKNDNILWKKLRANV